jgi:hypothetical protein
MTMFNRWIDGVAISKKVEQSKLTADCWSVQVWGLLACVGCELENKPDCGGKVILMRIRKGRFPVTGIKGRVTVEGRLME